MGAELLDTREKQAEAAAGTLPASDHSARPENYRRALFVFILVVTVAVGMFRFPSDDGLRHVGLAFSEPRTWGEVYPFSVYSENQGYDPWWGYDRFLRGCAAIMRPLMLPRIVAQSVVVKALSLCFIATFLVIVIRRAGLPEKVKSRGTLVAAAMLSLLFLSLPITRVLSVRPCVPGTLYLLFALAGGGLLRGVATAGVIGLCYPYLFWIYTLPVAAAHFLRGDRRFSAGTVALTAAGIALQPHGFWIQLGALLRGYGTRDMITTKIVELQPLAAAPIPGTVVLLSLICLLPFLPAAARRVGVPHLVMLFFMPAAIKHQRYMIDVEMPLLFVICAAGLLDPVDAGLQRIGCFWLERLRALWARLSRGGHVVRAATGGEVNLRPAIVATALALAVVLVFVESRRLRADEELTTALEAVPKGSLVLTDFNLQFRLLFLRPDLRLVPSCEIGYPSKTILQEYRRYINEGEPCELAQAIGAEWFIGPELIPFDPDITTCLGRKTRRAEEQGRPAIALWKLPPSVLQY